MIGYISMVYARVFVRAPTEKNNHLTGNTGGDIAPGLSTFLYKNVGHNSTTLFYESFINRSRE